MKEEEIIRRVSDFLAENVRPGYEVSVSCELALKEKGELLTSTRKFLDFKVNCD